MKFPNEGKTPEPRKANTLIRRSSRTLGEFEFVEEEVTRKRSNLLSIQQWNVFVSAHERK